METWNAPSSFWYKVKQYHFIFYPGREAQKEATMAEATTLPAPAEIEIADYLISRFLVELDSVAMDVKSALGLTISAEEALATWRSGGKIVSADVDAMTVLRLLEFATDVIEDAETIKSTAREMQRSLLAAWRSERELADPEGVRESYARIDAWFAAEAQERASLCEDEAEDASWLAAEAERRATLANDLGHDQETGDAS